MAIALTQGQKNTVDSFLAIVGLLVGWIASNVAAFPVQYQALASLIGLVGGYAVSDAVSYIDSGTLPAVTTIASQAQTVMTLDSVAAYLNAQIARLPPQEQGLPNAAIATIQAALQTAAAAGATKTTTTTTTPSP